MPEYKDVVELGTVLRRHRKAMKMSQNEVAVAVGVKQATVARWEDGRRPEPRYFDALAGFLDVERDLVVKLAHEPAAEDGLGDTLISAYGGRWYLLPLERRREIGDHIRELLDEGS